MYRIHSNDILPVLHSDPIEHQMHCTHFDCRDYVVHLVDRSSHTSVPRRISLTIFGTAYSDKLAISVCVTVRVLVRVSPSVFCFALFRLVLMWTTVMHADRCISDAGKEPKGCGEAGQDSRFPVLCVPARWLRI